MCTSCYKGYNLEGGLCVRAPDAGPSDLGCKTWDWDNQVCLECSTRWVMDNGVCVPVSDDCAEHDESGACIACYKGYGLEDGVCVRLPDRQPSDLGCAVWDWDNDVCLECSLRWVSVEGICVPVDDHCAGHN